jgi:hypothetical protein
MTTQQHACIITYTKLEKLKTPACITDSIIQGIQSHSPTGDVSISLSCTIEEQFKIGWTNMCQGHISTKWQDSFAELSPIGNRKSASSRAKTLILELWQYSKDIWKHRNNIVHGAMEQSHRNKDIFQLWNKVKELYKEFDRDKYCILSTRSQLFDPPFLTIQCMSRDAPVCFEEAIATRKSREELYTELSSKNILLFLSKTPPHHSIQRLPCDSNKKSTTVLCKGAQHHIL